jgi:hypothetical protein
LDPGPPITTWRPGPSGPSRWRSGWEPCSTSRHARHTRHGRVAGSSAVHSSPAARSSASVVLPMPDGPTSRMACGLSANHRPDRCSAAGDPGSERPAPADCQADSGPTRWRPCGSSDAWAWMRFPLRCRVSGSCCPPGAAGGLAGRRAFGRARLRSARRGRARSPPSSRRSRSTSGLLSASAQEPPRRTQARLGSVGRCRGRCASCGAWPPVPPCRSRIGRRRSRCLGRARRLSGRGVGADPGRARLEFRRHLAHGSLDDRRRWTGTLVASRDHDRTSDRRAGRPVVRPYGPLTSGSG